MQAYAVMRDMQQRIPNVNLMYYIDVHVIESIQKAMGLPTGPQGAEEEQKGVEKGRAEQERQEEEEEAEEEVVESDIED